ncbi:kinase-like domain-containing protein [Rhizophagus irregularis DAOM 181602=DAOM 197198]|nr:kinase-like domain-containing protein [Rhizophagus irregularis DAOM 181602=DAOM 197198]
MQFKTNNPDIVIKWISYSQFDEIKEIGKGGFATIYSAILNDFKVALKCLDNSQNLIDELLNEVKAYKVVLNNSRLSRILKVYGISQDPDTRNYIIVLYYAEESLRYISVSEIEEAENYRNLHLSTLKGDRKITTHSQAVYTSRLLNPFTECLDCAITD